MLTRPQTFLNTTATPLARSLRHGRLLRPLTISLTPRSQSPSTAHDRDCSYALERFPLSHADSGQDDIIALYSCEPTVDRVKRYTPDCVYDDQFVYANDRYKMAGQWFALPKLFKQSKNEGYEIIKNDRDLIQFKNEQSWTFKLIPKTATINALVSLSLDPGTVDSDFIQVKYHKDQANDKDYSRWFTPIIRCVFF